MSIETPWKSSGKLNWLWVMANSVVALFMVHPNRSRVAFEALVGGWEGILVSDGYRGYTKTGCMPGKAAWPT